MISLRWHRMTRTQRRNARAKWLPVPRQSPPLIPDEFVPLLSKPEGRALIDDLTATAPAFSKTDRSA